MPANQLSPRRFTIALSFPGEHRQNVEAIAEQLGATLSKDRLLYDKYHEEEFARLDLDVYLPNLYRSESELIVLFLCPEYSKKRWCNLEWRHIRQLIATDAAKRIMLLSFGNPGDLTEIGILPGDGYINIADFSAEQIAARIIKRLHINNGEEPSTAQSQITSIAWPAPAKYEPDIANRSIEFDAFCSLFGAEAKMRGLLLEGESNHGKTTFVGECCRYAGSALGTRHCVPIDFKCGRTKEFVLDTLRLELGSLLPRFSRPAGSHLDLRSDFRALQQPIVLFFDTYEKASEDAQEFVEGLILADLTKLPAVRVVVSGQKVPAHEKSLWSDSVQYFRLGPIKDPKEWGRYSQRHHPNLKPEHLQALTSATGGNPGVLRPLLKTLSLELLDE